MESFKTPAVPNWVREIEHSKYRNIFSYRLGNPNLWGTETLLGDWDGEYLLVAQDFYPTAYIEEGVRNGLANPYRHKPSIPTNTNLLKTLRHFGRVGEQTQNTDCNMLYVSACFLLRDDGIVRGPLPDLDVVLRLSAPVLNFTVENMPNLTTVVAMGGPAAKATKIGGLERTIREKDLRYVEVHHPAYALSDAKRFAPWEAVFAP